MRVLLFALALLAGPAAGRAQPLPTPRLPTSELDPPSAPIRVSLWSPERERGRHELRRQRYAIDLRLPSTLTGMGAGTVVLGALMVVIELGQGFSRDADVVLAGTVLAALGAATLLPGSIWLGIAAHRARELDHAIQALDAPELQLDLALGFAPGGVALRGTF